MFSRLIVFNRIVMFNQEQQQEPLPLYQHPLHQLYQLPLQPQLNLLPQLSVSHRHHQQPLLQQLSHQPLLQLNQQPLHLQPLLQQRQQPHLNQEQPYKLHHQRLNLNLHKQSNQSRCTD